MKFDRINIEIINTCNLKCSFCPEPLRIKTRMTVEQFKKVSSQLVDITNEVVFHLLGEPLSHPELSEIINESSKLKLPVHIVTNGLLLNEARMNTLLNPIIRQVSFSLQSFGNNFPHQNPSNYLKRIRSFVQKAEVQRQDLYINLRFWDLEGFQSQKTNHNQKIHELLSQVFNFSWNDVKLDVRKRKNFKLRGRLYLHFDSRFVWPDLSNKILQERGTCHGLKGHFGIHADGTVVPCCLDHNGDIPLGNAYEQTIMEILNSPRASAMREGFKAGKLVEELCKRCGYISRFDKDKKLKV